MTSISGSKDSTIVSQNPTKTGKSVASTAARAAGKAGEKSLAEIAAVGAQTVRIKPPSHTQIMATVLYNAVTEGASYVYNTYKSWFK